MLGSTQFTIKPFQCVIAKRTQRVAWARDYGFALGRLLRASIFFFDLRRKRSDMTKDWNLGVVQNVSILVTVWV